MFHIKSNVYGISLWPHTYQRFLKPFLNIQNNLREEPIRYLLISFPKLREKFSRKITGKKCDILFQKSFLKNRKSFNFSSLWFVLLQTVFENKGKVFKTVVFTKLYWTFVTVLLCQEKNSAIFFAICGRKFSLNFREIYSHIYSYFNSFITNSLSFP